MNEQVHKTKNVHTWIYVLFKMICLVGILLLAVLLKTGMFCKQFKCNSMIDDNAFQANNHVRKVKGTNRLIYVAYRASYLLIY